MRQIPGLDVRFKALDYLVLAYDVVELVRPVLLDPDLLFYERFLPDPINTNLVVKKD
jgi:hypothetical protein